MTGKPANVDRVNLKFPTHVRYVTSHVSVKQNFTTVLSLLNANKPSWLQINVRTTLVCMLPGTTGKHCCRGHIGGKKGMGACSHGLVTICRWRGTTGLTVSIEGRQGRQSRHSGRQRGQPVAGDIERLEQRQAGDFIRQLCQLVDCQVEFLSVARQAATY